MVGIMKKIKENFTKVNENTFITTTREGNCFALTTRCRDRPFEKKQDNYVIKNLPKTFSQVSEELSCTTTKEGDCFCLTQTRPTRPLEKRLTNYVLHNDDFKIRRLTPVECERLQGFPDGWTRYGKDGEEISDTQRYKCCGNAVTTNVITAIVNEMFDGVDKE